MARQRRRQIVLAVADAQLAQVAAERPHERHVAPAEPGFQHQAVIGVGFGEIAGEREQSRLDRSFHGGHVDRAAAGALQHHVVQEDPGAGPSGLRR